MEKYNPLSRRSFLRCVGTISAGIGLLTRCQNQKQPLNVLFMVFDDLGPHLASYGDPNAKKFNLTPNFDRLAEMSVQFNRSYCQVAICGPSRSSFLTGLRPDITSVNTDHDYASKYREDTTPAFFELIHSHPTLLNMFNQNGYYTARSGKVHHGFGVTGNIPWEPTSYEKEPDTKLRKNPPEYIKYTEASGLPSFWQDLNNPITKNHLNPWGGHENQKKTTIWEMHVDYDKNDPCRNRNTLWTERTLHAIDKAVESKKPFFIGFGPTATHDPYCQPKEFADKIDPRELDMPETMGIERPIPFKYYGGQRPWSDGTANWDNLDDFLDRKNIPDKTWEGQPLPRDGAEIEHEEIKRKVLQSYYAAIAFIDYQVGRILDKLEENNLIDNTIIVAFGDHGFHVYDHDIWDKTTNFEYATRTFTYIHTPNMKHSGTVTSKTIEFVDFYPTLLDLCGIQIPDRCQGISLKPLLDDPNRPWQKYAFTQFYKANQMGYAIRSKDYRYTAWLHDPDGRGGEHNSGPEYGGVVFEELYDLNKDPLETKNLVGDSVYENIRTDLKAKLFKVIKDPVNGYKQFMPGGQYAE
jgi:arylsulfatase A-like enzyme